MFQGRGTIRKKHDISHIQAFEILASVAGNFLQENESSILDNAASVKDPRDKDKQKDEEGSFKGDLFEHGTCSEIASPPYVTGLQGKHDNQRYMLNDYLFANEKF